MQLGFLVQWLSQNLTIWEAWTDNQSERLGKKRWLLWEILLTGYHPFVPGVDPSHDQSFPWQLINHTRVQSGTSVFPVRTRRIKPQSLPLLIDPASIVG